jgi:hypothetical protein
MGCCHMNRRSFLRRTTGAAAGLELSASSLGAPAGAGQETAGGWSPEKPFESPGRPLTLQPILMYGVAVRREAASWKSWGGVQSDEAADREAERIAGELKALREKAGFRLEARPVAKVKTPEEAARACAGGQDVTIVYPATGSGGLLRACLSGKAGNIIFLRHRSGPVYYWYEALSTKYLQPAGSAPVKPGEPLPVSADDVVVDDGEELLWRLRALYGVKNFLGAKVVALGGAGGKYDPEAPKNAREKYKLDIIDSSYEDLGKRIQSAMGDPGAMARAEEWTHKYLAVPGTTLETDRQFVVNAFVLHGIFKDILRERDARIFTINGCMGTILPMSRTTACLTLSLLNDEGLVAFCESDFVIIPPGILLHHISGKPVFLHNSTFPHEAVVTCAHCTAPRRMDGKRYEPARILTHYESEFGAAPKVEVPVGQELTFIDPEYSSGRWVGFKGKVLGNPFYEICRSQQDVEILGSWKKLLGEARDSHWMACYGDYLKEVGYAARRIGVTWESFSEGPSV